MQYSGFVNQKPFSKFTSDYKLNNIEYDKRHLWHPYTSATQPLPCYEVIGANGVELTLADSQVLIDGMSSWSLTTTGGDGVLRQLKHKLTRFHMSCLAG